MASLITREEALALGEIEDRAAIEALIERAWRARVERFGDSTDLCSLVNAKSGGCAEDCGFCAQSRYADAETPLHAMMEPEQILEHARAAEAAGAHRFCMVTQGQGLSRRDFDKILDGARLVAQHTNLKRCASIGHMSVERARALKQVGIQRVHHNVETAESYYPEVSTTVRYAGRLRTIDAVKRGRARDVRRRHPQPRRDARAARRDGIRAGGDQPDERADQPADPATRGRSSATASYMDPWEAVKWIAIFRLILPEALFRLCGGRVENLGELQQLAVKAGVNGVMMGNFLTTLGTTPDEDRAMFEQLGLNVARQTDNGANPRPDNRSAGSRARRPTSSTSSCRGAWVRLARGASVGSLDAAALLALALGAAAAPRRRNRAPASEPLRHPVRTPFPPERTPMTDLAARLTAGAGAAPADAPGHRVRRDRAWCSTAGRCCCCARTTTSGFADHPRVREAAADAAMRWGVGAGASRLVSGTMTIHDRLERRLAEFESAARRAFCSAPATSPTSGVIGALAGPGRGGLLRRAQPRLDRRRLPARSGDDVRLRPLRRRASRVGAAPARASAGP